MYRKWLVRTHLISRWQNLSRWWLATTFKIIEKHHFYFKVSGEALEYHVHLSWLFARWILYNYHPSMSWTWRFVNPRKTMSGWHCLSRVDKPSCSTHTWVINVLLHRSCYVPSCIPYMYFMLVFLKYYFCYFSFFSVFLGGGELHGLNEHLQFQLLSRSDVKIDILIKK